MNNVCLITGASGLLGRTFVNQMLQHTHVMACFNTHPIIFNASNHKAIQLDLNDLVALDTLIKKVQPSLIIHCAGLTNVDLCEKEFELALHLNVEVTRTLAVVSRHLDAKFVYISTDHLYDGKKSFYREEDPPNPVNIYGETKWKGEIAALSENPQSLVVRTNFFGKGTQWRQSLTDWIWIRLNADMAIPAFVDSYFTPIAISELVKGVRALIDKNATGIFNVCGSDRLSKYEFALRFSEHFGFKTHNIHPVKMQDCNLSAKRPLDMSLNVAKITKFLNRAMPTLEQSFHAIKSEYQT